MIRRKLDLDLSGANTCNIMHHASLHSNHSFLTLMTQLKQSCFSNLLEHKFRHDFKDTLNLLCSCGIEAEITTQYFRYHFCKLNH